jgi:hypothetical protein
MYVPHRHVRYARLRNSAILYGLGELVTPEAAVVGHGHVHASQGGSHTGVLRHPVGDDEALR